MRSRTVGTLQGCLGKFRGTLPKDLLAAFDGCYQGALDAYNANRNDGPKLPELLAAVDKQRKSEFGALGFHPAFATFEVRSHSCAVCASSPPSHL